MCFVTLRGALLACDTYGFWCVCVCVCVCVCARACLRACVKERERVTQRGRQNECVRQNEREKGEGERHTGKNERERERERERVTHRVHVYLLSHQTIPAIQSNKDIHNTQSNHIFTQSLYMYSHISHSSQSYGQQ